MVPIDVFPASAVAGSLIKGLEAGLYHLPSPDPVLNAMVASRAGVTPRGYPFLESLLLLPLASLLEAAASVYFDWWGRKYARREQREAAERAGKKNK